MAGLRAGVLPPWAHPRAQAERPAGRACRPWPRDRLAPGWAEPYLQRGLFERFHGDQRAAMADLERYLEVQGATRSGAAGPGARSPRFAPSLGKAVDRLAGETFVGSQPRSAHLQPGEYRLQASTTAPRAADTLANRRTTVTLGRLALNVAYRDHHHCSRFHYSPAAHVDLRTVGALVTVQVSTSVAGPLGGVLLADARGRRTSSAGLALLCGGAAVSARSRLRLAAFWPATRRSAWLWRCTSPRFGYLGARTSYARRSRRWACSNREPARAALLGVAPLMQLVQKTRGAADCSFGIILIAALLTSWRWCALGCPRRSCASRLAQRPMNWRALQAPSVLGMLALLFCLLWAST